jgi:hypothetical protein
MPEIKVQEYQEKYRDEWEDFVSKSNNGTMFHKQAFLDYHDSGKFKFHHLMFRNGDELVGVMPGGIHGDGKTLWSPTGASYGSIVTNDIPFSLALQIVDSLLDYARERNFRELYLIPPPLIYSHVYNQHIEYAMLYRKSDFELHYISHAVALPKDRSHFDDIDIKAQRIIRKIIKDGKLRIEESTNYADFYPILEMNKAKHKAMPTHSLRDLERLYDLMPENLKLFMVYNDDTPVAGSLLFLTNRKVALCFYIMMLYEYRHLKPVFLAMSESIRWAQENGYEWFDIGVSQDTTAEDPMTPSESLIYFKERFNARGILRTTYHFKLPD